MGSNKDIFTRLLDSTYTVPITRGADTYDLTIRELPFSTFMFIVTEFTTSARKEIQVMRRDIMEQIGAVGHIVGADMNKLVDLATPLIMTAVFQLPEAVNRIIMDTVVDITPEQAKRLTPDDTLTIISALIERLDLKKVADKTTKIFFQMREVVNMVQGQLPQQAEKSEASSSTSTETQLNTENHS